MAVNAKKLIIVGDGGCGKTSLLTSYLINQFFEEYKPTVYELNAVSVEFKGKPVQLELLDTAGQESYDRLRPIFYADVDLVLLCFAINSPDSLQNIAEKWYPEARHYCLKSRVPVILVGNKADLRAAYGKDKIETEEEEEIVTKQTATRVAKHISAVAYVECSAKDGKGITELIELATRTIMKKERSICSIV